MIRSPMRSVRHLQRYREIIRVFIRHGFGELVDTLGLLPYLSLPRRILRGEQPPRSPRGVPQRLRMALEDLGPTFIKLGQVLSTRPDLVPVEYVIELSKLQDTIAAVAWSTISEQIDAELGQPPEAIFTNIEPDPIAAASLAQVHAATLPDGSCVVVKVQRPNIQKAIETDLEILYDVARLAQERTSLGEIFDLPGIAEHFAATLRAELDFLREGRNAERFREQFADEDYLHIPQVYWEYTTRRLLVLERIQGIKIDDIESLDAAGFDRHQIAVNAARMIAQEVFRDGFFHADPHPGNLVIMPGAVIGVMDFGMVGYLNQRLRTDLLRLYFVAIEQDEDGIVDQLIRLGFVRGGGDRSRLQQDIGWLLRKYHGMPLGAVKAREAIEDFMPLAFRHKLKLPADLWLLGKTLTMVEGIGTRLDPSLDVFAVSRPFVRCFMWQWVFPGSWGPAFLKSASNWSVFLQDIPRVGSQVLNQIERGELEVKVQHQGLREALKRLDQPANRLSLSILLAALIVGLALLVPTFDLGEQWRLATGVVITGFVGVSLLGLWLIFLIWRSGKMK